MRKKKSKKVVEEVVEQAIEEIKIEEQPVEEKIVEEPIKEEVKVEEKIEELSKHFMTFANNFDHRLALNEEVMYKGYACLVSRVKADKVFLRLK